jgi:hypothetical protein
MATQVVDVAPGIPTPWRSMWLSPRRAMRAVLASEARPGITLVVALAALHAALATLGGLEAKGELSFNMAVMPVMFGVLRMVFGVLIGPFVLAISGGWFGGQAAPDEIRQSVAWSYAPFAVTAVCWIPMLLAPGGPVVSDAPTAVSLLKALLLVGASLVYFGALLWVMILQVVTLAEVEHFSTSRAFGSIIVWVIPVVLLSLL